MIILREKTVESRLARMHFQTLCFSGLPKRENGLLRKSRSASLYCLWANR